MHIYGILKDGNDNPICRTEKETQMYRTDFWTLWEKARVGWSERRELKHVYYLGWNRSPAQVGCMRQVLRPGALGWSVYHMAEKSYLTNKFFLGKMFRLTLSTSIKILHMHVKRQK